MSAFTKSQIRASLFPAPLSHSGCMVWGSCGILALGAKTSVLLYRCSSKSITFLRSIEIPDGSNPIQLDFPDINTIVNSKIIKNKFNSNQNQNVNPNQSFLECDDFSRYLAIATDSVSLFIFDCISGSFCGSFSKNYNPSVSVTPKYINTFKNAFSAKSTIHSIRWVKQYLIFLTSSQNLQNTSASSYLSVIDFWGDSDLSLHKENAAEEGNRRSSFHSNQSDNQNKSKSVTKVIYSVDLGEFYDRIEIDPFSMNGSGKDLNSLCCFSPVSHFRCLLYSTKTNIFTIFEAPSPSEPPQLLYPAQAISGVSFITDACFHPHIQNVIVILYSTSAVFYELNSRAVKSVITDSGPEMSRIFVNEGNSSELIVYCRDNSFVLYKQKERSKSRSKSDLSSASNSLDFEMSLDFEKVSVTQLKREVVQNSNPFLNATNRLFSDSIIAYSARYGLFLLHVVKGKKIIVAKNNLFAPMKCTAFDASDMMTVLGTESGGIFVINNLDGSVIHSFTVNGYEYSNFNSFSAATATRRRTNSFSPPSSENSPMSPSSSSLASPSGMISPSNSLLVNMVNLDEITNVRLLTNNIVYWSTIDRYGGIDLKNSSIFFYENRFFSSFVPIPIASNDEIIVVKRDRYAIGVNRVENLIFDVNNYFEGQKPNSIVVSSFLEKPISFNSEVVSVCVQQKSTPTTISTFGDRPAFAVLLRNSQIHFFNSVPFSSLEKRRESEFGNNSSDPVMRLRCDKLPQPVSIAWKQNVFVTCDFNGKFMFFDFEYPTTTKVASSPFGNIRRVEFDKSENGLFIHSQIDCRLGFYANDKVDVCKSTQVFDFSTTGNGLVSVITPSRVVKILCLNRDWVPIIEIAQQSVTKPLSTVGERYSSIIDDIDSIPTEKQDVLPIERKIDYVIWKSKMAGLSYPNKLFMVIKKFVNGLRNSINSNENFLEFFQKMTKADDGPNEKKINQEDLNEFENEIKKEPSVYYLPPRYSIYSSTGDEICQSNIFKANLLSNVEDPDFFESIDTSQSNFNLNMEAIMKSNSKASTAGNMNTSPNGNSNGSINDDSNMDLISFVSHTRSIIERALLNVLVGKIEDARDTFLSFSPTMPFYPFCALAASLLGSKICETGVGVLKGASISLFDQNNVNSALLILSIAKLSTFAAQILQERELYDESVSILRLSCFSKSTNLIEENEEQEKTETGNGQSFVQENLNIKEIDYYDNFVKNALGQESNDKNLNSFLTVRGMMRRAAHFFFDSGQYEKASLLFASLGDFHPVVAIASARKQYYLAYLLLTVFKESGLLKEYDAAKGPMSPQQIFDIQFDTLEFLERHIKNKYEQLMQNPI